MFDALERLGPEGEDARRTLAGPFLPRALAALGRGRAGTIRDACTLLRSMGPEAAPALPRLREVLAELDAQPALADLDASTVAVTRRDVESAIAAIEGARR